MASTTSLGRGLELRDGDLVVENGRLAELSGPPNLAQALVLRVLTPLGSDRFATGYGLDVTEALTRAATARQAADLLQLGLVRTLAGDARVREIRDIQVLDPPGGPRRTWQARVTLVAVDGAEHTVPVEVTVR